MIPDPNSVANKWNNENGWYESCFKKERHRLKDIDGFKPEHREYC